MASANSETSAKPRGKPWKKGQSGNPAGRPAEGQSWAAVWKFVTDKTSEELSEMVGGSKTQLGRDLLKMPKGVAMKHLIAVRVLTQLMFDPDARLLVAAMDREAGKPTQALDLKSDAMRIVTVGIDIDRV